MRSLSLPPPPPADSQRFFTAVRSQSLLTFVQNDGAFFVLCLVPMVDSVGAPRSAPHWEKPPRSGGTYLGDVFG